MAKPLESEQERFWAGEFGDAYTDRNSGSRHAAGRIATLARILARTQHVTSAIEFGANVGQNLAALRHLIPECRCTGVEINAAAAARLRQVPDVSVFEGSFLNYQPSELGVFDLAFTAGVLIHVDPNRLAEAYSRLYDCSRSFICVIEYYNPTPIEVTYRGHQGRLFKRDFAGELLDRYPDLELVDYGFRYHRDANFPADDTTWFLLRKRQPGT